MRALEAQLLHPLADLRNAHEQLPDETAPVVLDHDDDRPLTDREVAVSIPVRLLTEAVDEAEPPPDFVAKLLIEVPERRHRLSRRIGEARKRRARRNDALVVDGRVRVIAFDRVACGEAPAVWPVALVAMGVADAVGIVDARVSDVLLPVVGVVITQPTRIDAAEGVMGEEERSAPVRSERKLHALEVTPIDELAALDPAFVIGFSHHSIARRRGCQNISNEALVPTTDRMVQREAIGRAPVPREGGSSALSVPIPLGFAPEIGYAITNALLLRRIAIEIGAGA